MLSFDGKQNLMNMLKKCTLLLLAVPLIGFGQYAENFEGVTVNGNGIGDVPNSMKVYNVDGLTPAANVGAINQAWKVILNGGNKFAVSTSWYNPPGTSDDWIVTPAINVPATNPFLFFDAMAPDQQFPDGYQVYISTTGDLVQDFSTMIASSNGAPASFTTTSVDLSVYAGQQVWIAWRNNSNDKYLLYLDNIEVRSVQPDDAALVSVAYNRYGVVNTNENIRFNVSNAGANAITSLTLEWEESGNIHTYNATGLNIAPGATSVITHNQALNYATPVEILFNARITSVNGNTDPNTQNNEVQNRPFNAVSQKPVKNVVIEEGTGTWCMWCPRGAVAMDFMYSNYASNFIGIAVHNNDPMAVAAYDGGANFSGYPSCNVDREILDASVSQNNFVAYYNQRKDLVVPFDVSVNSTYNATTRAITANISANSYTNFAAANYRFAVIVVEDSVTGTSSGYAQVNAYAGGGNGPMGGYENLPNPVPASQMVYNHVGRSLLGGYAGQSGSIPASLTDGQNFSYSFNYTLPNTMDDNQIILVGLILDNTTGVIVNAAKMKLAPSTSVVENELSNVAMNVFPNPTSDVLKVDFDLQGVAGNATAYIYNQQGQIVYQQNIASTSGQQLMQVDVSGFAAGAYYFTIATNNGAVVKQFIRN